MYMFKYILKRLGLLIMTFLIIEVICFVLIKLLPIVVDVQMGKDKEILEEQFRARGYYDPIPVQFFNYIKRIITENCGPANGKNYLSYEGLPPEEPKMPISKAQFYYKLQLLMKEILNV